MCLDLVLIKINFSSSEDFGSFEVLDSFTDFILLKEVSLDAFRIWVISTFFSLSIFGWFWNSFFSRLNVNCEKGFWIQI